MWLRSMLKNRLKVQTVQYPVGAWLYTKLCMVMSVCMHSAWDALARFMTYSGGGRVLNNFRPNMTVVRASIGGYGIEDECVIISIDTSLKDGKETMYGVIFPLAHHGPRYLDVPLSDINFSSPTPPIIATIVKS